MDMKKKPALDSMRCPVAPLYFLFLAAVAATSYSINRKGTLELPDYTEIFFSRFNRLLSANLLQSFLVIVTL